MEKFMYPSPYMRITQGYGIGTHKGSFAIDDGGSDSGKDYAIAPYSGTVKIIYSQYENEVFFESDEQVEFADGSIDFATTMFCHQNSPMAYGMAVGKHYNQGDKIYIEGGRYEGQNDKLATHFHFEFAKGKCKGWYKNSAGIYSIVNGKKPEECCFIDNSYHILNDNNYKFVNLDHGIKYKAHVQEDGWQDWKRNGEMAGTTGQKKRLEALMIDYPEVEAKAHLESIGWVNYGKLKKDTVIGSVGQKRRMECLCLKGNIKYRVYLEKTGWTCWTEADGVATLGSVGQELRIEAIEITTLP